MLPLAVPEVRFRHVTATFVDESGAAVGPAGRADRGRRRRGARELDRHRQRPGHRPNRSSASASASDPARRRAPTRTGPAASLYTVLRLSTPRTGSSQVRGFSGSGAGTPDGRRNAWFEVWPVTACSVRPTSPTRAPAAPGSRPRSTSAPCTRSPAPASRADVWASVDGARLTTPLTTRQARRGSSRGRDRRATIPFAAAAVELNWKWEQTSRSIGRQDVQRLEGNPSKAFADVQQVYSAGDDSGPIKAVSLHGRQVYDDGVLARRRHADRS